MNKLHLMSCEELSKLAKTLPDKSKEKYKVLNELLRRDSTQLVHRTWPKVKIEFETERRGFGQPLLTVDSYAL